MGSLDGKAVVVTGAGGGLGAVVATHAAAAGAAVLVNDVDGDRADQVVRTVRDAGGRAVASAQSVHDPDQADAIVGRCLAEFGSLDGLVTGAAVHHEALPWDDDPDRVRELVEVNVLGVLFCGMAASRWMRRQRGGTIVNVCSDAAFGRPRSGAYAASKGAVASLSHAWALDLAQAGVRVNAVCPPTGVRMMAAPRVGLAGLPDPSADPTSSVITYLLGDRSAGITGKLIRLQPDQLQVVGEPAVERLLRWNADDVAAAFDGVLPTPA